MLADGVIEAKLSPVVKLDYDNRSEQLTHTGHVNGLIRIRIGTLPVRVVGISDSERESGFGRVNVQICVADVLVFFDLLPEEAFNG